MQQRLKAIWFWIPFSGKKKRLPAKLQKDALIPLAVSCRSQYTPVNFFRQFFWLSFLASLAFPVSQ